MYVCVCNAVTEREVRDAIERGAKSVGALKEMLGVATNCGSCLDTVVEHLLPEQTDPRVDNVHYGADASSSL